ncbi:MAG TPA: hypothetical protein VKA60_13240 [Blastocatellia bacterium]|nr:hypothetical protein [Blastocatellia bacterium]
MESRPVREFDVELPVGYLDEDGRLHRSATLRKMTGHEEALLADRKLRHNGGALVTELLSSCVRRLGELTTINRKVVAHLTSPDRNYLLMELRKITFGSELEANYACPHCGETSRVLHDLDELPVRRVNGEGVRDIVVELEDGWEDKDGQLYLTMVFRLPNGVDEEKVAGALKENPSRGMNALLTRCMVALGDMPQARREALGTKVLSDLTMSDRALIESAFREETPGVDLSRQIDCDACGRSFKASLDLTSFFTVRQGARTNSARKSSF